MTFAPCADVIEEGGQAVYGEQPGGAAVVITVQVEVLGAVCVVRSVAGHGPH